MRRLSPSRSGAGDLLPPGALGRRRRRSLGAPLAPAGQRPPAADRDQAVARSPRSGRRRGRPGRRRRRGGCAAPRPPGSRRPRSAPTGPRRSRAGPHREDLRGAARRQRRRGGPADRALVPALGQLLDLVAQLAADEDVQLVALAQLGRAARRDRAAVADDHVDQRLARQLQLAHRVPGRGRARAAAGRRSRRRPCGGSAPTRAAAAAAPARRWSARAASPAARSWRPGPGSR